MDNKKRKYIRIAYIFWGALIIVGQASFALAIELYIPAMQGRSGESVDIPVMIDQVDNLAGVRLVVNYDTGVLSFKNGAKTKHTSSLMHIVNSKKSGVLIIAMAGAKGISGKNFAIFQFTFTIKKGLKDTHFTKINIASAQLMNDKLKDLNFKIKTHPLKIVPDALNSKK